MVSIFILLFGFEVGGYFFVVHFAGGAIEHGDQTFVLIFGVVQGIAVDVVEVGDDFAAIVGFEFCELEIGRGDLQGVEHAAGSFSVDAVGEDAVGNLHDGELHGVGVFERRDVRNLAGVEFVDVVLVPLAVEVAVLAAFECGGAALDTVEFDLNAALTFLVAWVGHGRLLPYPPTPPDLLQSRR